MTPEERKKASDLHDQLARAKILLQEASHMLAACGALEAAAREGGGPR
jgi:hypothetical protein